MQSHHNNIFTIEEAIHIKEYYNKIHKLKKEIDSVYNELLKKVDIKKYSFKEERIFDVVHNAHDLENIEDFLKALVEINWK